MPKHAKPLTELEVRNARAKQKAYTLPDGKGLYLQVSKAGLKTWVVRFRLPGSKTATPASIGYYPAMSLADARVRAIQIQQDAKAGKATPGVRKVQQIALASTAAEDEAQKQAEIAAERSTLKATARRWLADNHTHWAEETYRKARLVVEGYFVKEIGDLDIRSLQSKDVRSLLLRMAESTPQLARKAKQYIGRIVEQAIDEGLRPEESALRLDRLLPARRPGHMPAVTDDESRLGDLMRAIDAYSNRVVRAALLLAAWTTVRSGVVASARWSEIDLERAEWRIPGKEPDGRNRMKTGIDFDTSLPTQAIDVLMEMRQRSHGAEYVFPPQARQQSAHLSRDSLSKALREMNFKGEHTTHGFRASFRTLGRERLDIDADVLEAQLAHAPKNELEAAYARVKFRDKRRLIVQSWADYLEELKIRGGIPKLLRQTG
ncbi:Prophage CP4-57 integrase [Dyella sp. AD56]|uniref:tyrosine-type recombinase/integrase n=1 Tax=Dyella sp. AD56 TaxID=1528744 RepID=UPI000C8280A6|nr:integrase arm-type DNA-binding domain-containing protein [Dyella sp. AD56]PMQ02888.1 Prophage CP4-57 integrase [Dyella sp. AD56]